MRQLRTYQRVAQQLHWCDRCCRDIHPGEMYEGCVWLHEDRDKHRLSVFKVHINPSCDYPEDPDKYRKTEEDGLEGTVKVETKSAAA